MTDYRGSHIKKKRLSLGWSIRDLADRCEKSKSWVVGIENGANPTLTDGLKLAAVLGKSPHWIIDGIDSSRSDKQIPVVGDTWTGPTDKQTESLRVAYSGRTLSALKVVQDMGIPIYKNDDYLLFDPTEPLMLGEDVIFCTNNIWAIAKLANRTNDVLYLEPLSVNGQARLTLKTDEVSAIYAIVGSVKYFLASV